MGKHYLAWQLGVRAGQWHCLTWFGFTVHVSSQHYIHTEGGT